MRSSAPVRSGGPARSGAPGHGGGSIPGRALLALAMVQLGASLFATLHGPLAISDDDYARVVIAQNLAAHPKLDPTGTSWLPFPFYITGAAMAAFGTTLDVARQTQVLLALASAGLLYAAARRLGHTPWLSVVSAGLAAALPSAAHLGIATVPEYPTAACLVFGMACLGRPPDVGDDGRGAGRAKTHAWFARVERVLGSDPGIVLGGLALYLACASRYEAWPVAGTFAGITFCRGLRAAGQERKSLWMAAGAAAAFPLLWLLHGAFWHGDPFFFFARVSRYKAALGGTEPPGTLFAYPVAALRHEPGACFLLAVGLLLALITRASREAVRRARAIFAALAALVLFLVLGDLRGGAPTHHPERALLSLWLIAPALGLHLLQEHVAAIRKARPAPDASASPWRTPIPFVLAFAVFLTLGLRAEPGAFANRTEEERLGRALAETKGQVVLFTPDYGYFAVQAASGAPSRFHLVDRNDPRDPRSTISAEERTRAALEETRAPWAVVPLGLVVPGYRMIEHGSRLALLQRDQTEVALAAP